MEYLTKLNIYDIIYIYRDYRKEIRNMFDLNSIMKMAGISTEMVDQLMGVKNMLDKLPKETQVKLMTDFTDSLTNAVKELEAK